MTQPKITKTKEQYIKSDKYTAVTVVLILQIISWIIARTFGSKSDAMLFMLIPIAFTIYLYSIEEHIKEREVIKIYGKEIKTR